MSSIVLIRVCLCTNPMSFELSHPSLSVRTNHCSTLFCVSCKTYCKPLSLSLSFCLVLRSQRPSLVLTTPPFMSCDLKGIVHFEIKIWYVSAYPKGIQDVGVFFSSVDPILMFLGQTVLVCQSYNGRYRSLSLWEGKRTCTEKFKLNNSPS